MSATLPVVLFVDDEERILRSLRMLFRGKCELLTTTSGEEAIAWVRQRPVDVVVSDQRMPGMTGVEVLRAVAAGSPNTMRVLLTGYADMDAVTAAVNEGEIYRFIEKPWSAAHLVDVVLHAASVARSGPTEATSVTAPSQAPATMQVPADRPLAARVLVLERSGDIGRLVRELLPGAVGVEHAATLEQALDFLASHHVAAIVAELASAGDDVSGALKQLKHLRPATLAIVVTNLRDSRLLISLINEGQIFRFLLQPIVRELLRRGLAAALERHEELRAQSALLKRYDVDAPKTESASVPERLRNYWKRLRETTFAKVG